MRRLDGVLGHLKVRIENLRRICEVFNVHLASASVAGLCAYFLGLTDIDAIIRPGPNPIDNAIAMKTYLRDEAFQRVDPANIPTVWNGVTISEEFNNPDNCPLRVGKRQGPGPDYASCSPSPTSTTTTQPLPTSTGIAIVNSYSCLILGKYRYNHKPSKYASKTLLGTHSGIGELDIIATVLNMLLSNPR